MLERQGALVRLGEVDRLPEGHRWAEDLVRREDLSEGLDRVRIVFIFVSNHTDAFGNSTEKKPL